MGKNTIREYKNIIIDFSKLLQKNISYLKFNAFFYHRMNVTKLITADQVLTFNIDAENAIESLK